ncbi:MAG: pilin [Patescibacteria group bacterium]
MHPFFRKIAASVVLSSLLSALLFLSFSAILIPAPVAAASNGFFGLQKPNLIVCGDFDNPDNTAAAHECTFADVVLLAKNVVNFAFYLSVPAVILLLSYAGYLYMTSAGDEGKVGQAHTIFTNVAIGFCIILAAWLIVTTLLQALLNQVSYPILKGNTIEIK